MIQLSQTKEIKLGQDSPNKSGPVSNVFVLIKWFTGNQKNSSEAKLATLNELNQQLRTLLASKNKQDIDLVVKQASILCMRPLLVDNIPKETVITYFKILLISTEVGESYKKFNIPLLISKILEKDNKDIIKGFDSKASRPADPEILECLRFIRTWIQVSAKTIPKLLVSSMMAFAEMPLDEKQSKRECINLEQKLLAVDTIRLLAVHNFQLWNWSGGIAIMINAISDPMMAEKSQDIVYTLLYLLNEPKIRNKTHLFEDLNKIFWIFTDIDVNPDRVPQKTKTDEYGNNLKTRFSQQLDLSKKAVITIMKSWVGLIYLGNETKTLKSFIESLRQKLRPEIRFAIYQILESLLSIGHQSYKTKDISKESNLKISNLLNCYLITLVQLLIDCDLFKILVQLSGLEDSEVSVPAQKFLKQLTILMFNSLPNSSKYIDFLISAATQSGDYSIQLKSCSSYVINKIGNYIFDSKIKQEPVVLLNQLESMYVSSNLFIPLAKASIAETTYAINLLQQEQSNKDKNSSQSHGLQRQNKHKYQKWKWQRIEETLKNAYDTKTKLDVDENKFIPYLLKFFNPSQSQFINFEWKMDNFKYLRVGQLLFKNLVTLSSYISILKFPSKSQFEVTIPFIEEIKLILTKLLENCLKMTPLAFLQTMQRQIVYWFGLLSYTKQAYLQLLIGNGIFQAIDSYVGKYECDVVISTLLFSFDYNRENVIIANERDQQQSFGPRSLLQNSLMRGSNRLVLQGIEIMKILYRTQVSDFQNWGFELLARTLLEIAPRDPEIMASIMDLLTQAFDDRYNLINFIKQLDFERLNTIREKLSTKFLIKILSNETGFNNISKYMGNWLDDQFNQWMTNKNLQYNNKMEIKLNDALNFVEPKSQGYSMKQPNNFIESIYIYKLPWVAQIQSMYFPLMPFNKNYGFSLEGDVNLQIPDDSLVQLLLMIGVMYVDFKLNCMGQEKPKNTKVQVDLRDKSEIIYKEDGQFDIVKQKITFTFARVEENTIQVLYLKKVKIELKLRKPFDDSVLPIHLIGQLAKTPLGVEYLKQKKAHNTFVDVVQNKDSNANQVRASLWALGFMGSCNHGMLLIKQLKVVDILIKMCFSHSYLSLRGTCRYILNMICSVSEGRKQITERGWLTNSNSCIGWICVPPQLKKFFTIQQIDPNFWPNNNVAWTAYNAALEPLSEKQKQLIRSISLMSNTLSFKVGQQQVKKILSNSNTTVADELRSSPKLFKNIILLITYYNFKLETRRSIFMMFDQYIRSAKFMNEMQNTKFYII